MLVGDSPEVITKTGNTIKTMKTYKKDTGRQNRKRPAEAAGSFHKLRMTVGMQLITMPRSPFELRISRQTTSDTNAEVMDIGLDSAERPTTAVNSELAGDLLCKKTSKDFF